MDGQRARRFAEEWYAAWNAHGLDAVLDHYGDDVEMARRSSPRSPAASAPTALVLHYRSGGRPAAEVVFLGAQDKVGRYSAHYSQ
jgi:hypothetical protein